MVRNTRVLMMCGLLATATAIALGGSAIPATRGEPAWSQVLAMLVPGLGLWSTRNWVAEDVLRTRPAVITAPHAVAEEPFEDGAREPRQPREPREGRDALR